MTLVQLVPARVDVRLYTGNTGAVVFAWDELPALTGWTAVLKTAGIADLPLDVTVDGDDLIVTIPDPAAYLGKTTKLEVALDDQVIIAGHLSASTDPGAPSTQTVDVRTTDAVVAITAGSIVVADIVLDGGTPEDSGPDILDGGAP